ncbi:hypothetical protein [Rhizosphaericola mali]|uniref:DUF4468 domain-containing protein n=1 Tax=Rhizosphaericola mali TaxID=2545455 RepID=A0A5P2G5A7_9BACT|nr:hypothetical protein [Rhizosphaericola mali]QES89329.1 hypothetical protein E0W69_011875 [Rhizosphaericola mali]
MKILLAFILAIISFNVHAQNNPYYENLIPEMNGQRMLKFHFILPTTISDNEILQVVKDWLTHGFSDHLINAKQTSKNSIDANAEFGIHHKKLIKVAGNIVRYNLSIIANEKDYFITFSNIKLTDDQFAPIIVNNKERTLADVVNDCYNDKKLADLNNSRVAIQIIYDRLKDVAGSLREAELNYSHSIK